jgi:hypothetical protein|nr:MAG TPA: tail protein [Caudoviricetes sp.]
MERQRHGEPPDYADLLLRGGSNLAATIYEPLSTAHLKSCTVDFDSRPDKKAVNLVQYDQTIPVLCVSLKKGGTEYKVPSDADVNIRMDKRDGYHVYNPALGVNAERTIAYFAVTPQMSTGWGDYYPIVEITVGGGIAGSAPIWLHFDRNPLPENAIISSDEYKTIQQLLEDVKAVKADTEAIKTATEQIKAQTEAVRDQANGFADNAKNSADKAQTLVDGMPSDYSQAIKDIGTLKNQMQRAYPDDSTIGENPWSSKNIVDMLCPEIKESGNPVLCYPVAGYPLGVKASWEPVQEGSGTPYPAGGGKNQLNPAGYEAATKTVNGITFTRLNTGEVVINGTATGTAIYVLIANFSYLVSLSTDRNWSIAGENVIFAQGLVSGVTVIRPSDNTSLYIRVQSGETVKTTVQPQIEKGSTPTAWEPYENIRPIKGRDSVAVERCGENLLDIAAFSLDTDKGNRTYKTNVQQLIPPGKYTLKVTQTNPNSGLGMQLFTRDGKKISVTSGNTFNLDGILDSIYFYISNLSGNADSIKDIMLIPSTATAPTTYTPYIGQTNTLTLPETVYGGEVDAVSGEGQETWKTITLNGTESFDEEESKQYSLPLRETSYIGICSHFKNINVAELQNHVFGVYLSYARKAIFNTNFSSLDEFKQYLMAQFEAGTPIQICYTREPNTPNPTFTATGGVPIKAFSGTNTVLTDADSATVTGRADPIKRITDLEDAVASQT